MGGYTPGPWSFDSLTHYVTDAETERTQIAHVLGLGMWGIWDEEAAANARLIAASPTMYETLALAEELLSFYEGCAKPEFDGAHPTLRINGEDFANLLADIRAALSKAAGEGV